MDSRKFSSDRPAFAKPKPNEWSDDRVTAAWLGHATVLINFFGINILTDPVLFPRVGIRIPFLFTIGPKRLTAPALTIHELPKIDIIILSHAHFDHIDTRTLHRFDASTKIVTAPRTRDLLRWTKLRDITELSWGQRIVCRIPSKLDRFNRSSLSGASVGVNDRSSQGIKITAIPVKHWGARMQYDDFRGYSGYLIERNDRRIFFAGDTTFTETFSELRKYGPLAGPGSAGQLLQSRSTAASEDTTGRSWATQLVGSTSCPPDTKWVDLAIFAIAAYNPWIRSHATPEQAIKMANDAGARFIMPVHHQTFRLSVEPLREPIERFVTALRDQPERIALREIDETFVLPS